MADLHLVHEDTSEDTDSDSAAARSVPRHRRKGKKSGSSRTADDIVVRDIAWPHYPVYVGLDRHPLQYGSLTPEQFVFGYLHNMQLESRTVQRIMLSHLQDLMQDAMDYSWETARSYHKLLLQQFERNLLSWKDSDRIAEFRRTHAHRGPLTTVTNASSAPKKGSEKQQYCAAYQRGACQQRTDHTNARGFVRHICAYCLRITQTAYPHSEADCRRKQSQQQSKNEEL